MSDNDDAASYEWPTIRPERLLHTVAFMEVIGARPGRKQAFRLPSPALIALFPVDIGDSDWFVESSCGPNRWKHRAPRRHRALIVLPAGAQPRLLRYSARSSCPITLLGMRRDREGDRR